MTNIYIPGHHTLQAHKQIKYPHSDHTGHIQARICRPRPISGVLAQRETAHFQTKAAKKTLDYSGSMRQVI